MKTKVCIKILLKLYNDQKLYNNLMIYQYDVNNNNNVIIIIIILLLL